MVTPRGAQVAADYNARRQPLYEETRAGATAVAPQTAATVLSRTDWVYDDVGRVVEERRASDMPGLPHAITATLYTLTDQPQSVTDPLGRVTSTDYDALDRPIRLTAPWEAGKTRVSEVLYDPAGRKRIERSAVGTELVQDSATYTYWDDDAVRTITDPRGHALTHGYDGFGRLSILSYADGASESYEYDASDNRTGFTQRDGTVSTTTYDALNRPTSIKRPGLPETSYGLDILGRVVVERAGSVTVRTHVYDSAGRQQSASITLPRPATGVTGVAPTVAMSFTHDADGNRTGATWSGGTVGWRYDGLNRVTGVDFGADAVTRHSYDLLGRRTATTRGAASSAYGYDIAGQLKSLNHAWSGGSLAASYGYDDAGALINEVLDNNAFRWEPAPTLAKTTTYDPASPINALTAVDGVTQTHDARGNRTGAAGRTWRYDTRNMLVGANAPGMAASYGYYPEGGRAWKQVNGVTTLYLELDGIEWGTYDPTGTLKERTIRASGAGGAVVAVHSPTAGLIRLLPNRQGSIIGWLRPDGKLGGAYTYDAYGNSPQAGAAGPSFRYAGMRFDAETGLYHTPNRAYDPQDGRWVQLDPIGIKDGLNRYAYVRNAPSMGVDPTGLYTCEKAATTGSRISTGSCSDVDKFVEAARSIFKNIDKSTVDEKIYNRIEAAINRIGEKDQGKFKFTVGRTRTPGAGAEATGSFSATVDTNLLSIKSKQDASPARNSGMSPSGVFSVYGAAVIMHEVAAHSIDMDYGLISGKPAIKATEMKGFTIQSVMEKYGKINTSLYDEGNSATQNLLNIDSAAKRSADVFCAAYPQHCR